METEHTYNFAMGFKKRPTSKHTKRKANHRTRANQTSQLEGGSTSPKLAASEPSGGSTPPTPASPSGSGGGGSWFWYREILSSCGTWCTVEQIRGGVVVDTATMVPSNPGSFDTGMFILLDGRKGLFERVLFDNGRLCLRLFANWDGGAMVCISTHDLVSPTPRVAFPC